MSLVPKNGRKKIAKFVFISFELWKLFSVYMMMGESDLLYGTSAVRERPNGPILQPGPENPEYSLH